MSDVKKIATRESYGRTLVELGKENDKIVVLDADLAESTKTGVFKKAFPERHFDCGIAEADMIGIAAGLAAAGMVPFASSFAMFAAGRAFAGPTEPPINANRELLASGAANLGGALFGAMPAGGGTSQTAVVRAAWPWLMLLLSFLLVITYIPAVTMALPNWLGMP